jgi:hypothetical protein
MGMTSFHIGDNNTTHGANSPITTARSGHSSEAAAIEELVRAVQAMRAQVSGSSRQAADEFLGLAGSDAPVQKHELRETLVKIGGVATLVGQVGVPVIQAIQKVSQVLHL